MNSFNVPARAIFGTRGSGKTQFLRNDLMDVINSKQMYVLLIDPPGELARMLLGDLWASGRRTNIFYHEARWTKNKLCYPLITRPEAVDELELQDQITLLAGQLADGLFAKRGVRDGSEKPYTYEYTMQALRIYLTLPLPELPNPRIILDLFHGGPNRAWMLNHCGDRDAARAFMEAIERSQRSPQQWERETGASYRLLSILKESAVWTVHGQSYSREQAAINRSVELLGLQGLDRNTQRAVAIFTILNAVHTAIRYYTRFRKPLPMLICIEEAGALNLIFPQLLDVIRLWRKAGITVYVVAQSLLDFGDEILEQLMGLCDEQAYFRLATGTDRASKAALTKVYNPKAVLETRTRMEHSGNFQEVRTESSTTQLDKDYHQKGKSVSEGVTYRPIFQSREEVIYKTSDVQLKELENELGTLPTGEYRLVTPGELQYRRSILRPDPWPLGLTDIRTDKAIAELRLLPEYGEPTTSELPLWNQPQPTPSVTKRKTKRRADSDL